MVVMPLRDIIERRAVSDKECQTVSISKNGLKTFLVKFDVMKDKKNEKGYSNSFGEKSDIRVGLLRL